MTNTPPEADVMELARYIFETCGTMPLSTPGDLAALLTSRFTAHGDQRAAKAETRAAAMESFLAGTADVIDHAKREARAEIDFQHKNRDNAVVIIEKLKAEIARLTKDRDEQLALANDCQRTIANLHAPYWPRSITEHIAEIEAEIARLRAPPEADGMEQAKWILDHIPHGFDAEEPAVQLIARALTAYGDQRAREARDSLREQGYCMVCGVYHRVGACEAVENARREARAAAIEEAAQLCDDAFRDGRLDREYACETADELAARIRALADTPPQSD